VITFPAIEVAGVGSQVRDHFCNRGGSARQS
jgi:hypothetical protein